MPEAALADGINHEPRYRPLCSFGGGALSCLGGAACFCGGGALWVSLGALALGALSRDAGFGAELGLFAACGWVAVSVRGAFVACEAGAGDAFAA